MSTYIIIFHQLKRTVLSFRRTVRTILSSMTLRVLLQRNLQQAERAQLLYFTFLFHIVCHPTNTRNSKNPMDLWDSLKLKLNVGFCIGIYGNPQCSTRLFKQQIYYLKSDLEVPMDSRINKLRTRYHQTVMNIYYTLEHYVSISPQLMLPLIRLFSRIR